MGTDLRRYVATDLTFFKPIAGDVNPDAYGTQADRNRAFASEHGVRIIEGWDVFDARRKWNALFNEDYSFPFGALSPPRLILCSGLWLNSAPGANTPQSFPTGAAFLGLATEALIAQFPGATIVHMQRPHHLHGLRCPRSGLILPA